MAGRTGSATALRRLMTEYKQLTSQGALRKRCGHGAVLDVNYLSLTTVTQEPPMGCSQPVQTNFS